MESIFGKMKDLLLEYDVWGQPGTIVFPMRANLLVGDLRCDADDWMKLTGVQFFLKGQAHPCSSASAFLDLETAHVESQFYSVVNET